MQSGKFQSPGLHSEHLMPSIFVLLQVHIPLEVHDLYLDPCLSQSQAEICIIRISKNYGLNLIINEPKKQNKTKKNSINVIFYWILTFTI